MREHFLLDAPTTLNDQQYLPLGRGALFKPPMEKNEKGQVIRKNHAGMKYGHVTVLDEWEDRPNGGCRWKYRCDCGREDFAWPESMERNKNFSCQECRKDVLRKLRTIHGGRYTHKYQVWRHMRARCDDPRHKSYKDYGGRGIKVCPQWYDFAVFDADTGEFPGKGYSIERINNNGNYEPGNVKWATAQEQLNNQRRNKFLTYNGKTQTYAQWGRELGIDRTRIRQRVILGWPIEKILSKEKFRHHSS